LTASGGELWENLADPDWDRFYFGSTGYDGSTEPGAPHIAHFAMCGFYPTGLSPKSQSQSYWLVL
jgi:hypothetical protein